MSFEQVLTDLNNGRIETSEYSRPESDGTDIEFQRSEFVGWFRKALVRNRIAWRASIDLAEQDWVDRKVTCGDTRYTWSPFQIKDASSCSTHGSEVWWMAFVLKQITPQFLLQTDLDTGKPFLKAKKGHRLIPPESLHNTPVEDVDYGGCSDDEPEVVTPNHMMMQPCPENFKVKQQRVASFDAWLDQASKRLAVNNIDLPDSPSESSPSSDVHAE